MPCTLQPWEVEYEEKAYHKRKHGLNVTHAGFTEAVACWLAKNVNQSALKNAPAYVKSWIEKHNEEDKHR